MTGAPTGAILCAGVAAVDADANEVTETSAKIPTSAIFLSMVIPPESG